MLFDSPAAFVSAILTGFVVGGIVGMTGVGGGSLMTPILLSVFRLPTHVAIGTDLWFAALTKAGGMVAHARHQNVEWLITRRLLMGSMPGVLLTLLAMHFSGGALVWKHALNVALGVALLLTAVTVALRPKFQRLGMRLQARLGELWRVRLTVLSGLVLGVLVTLSSVGAGAIGVTLIVLLYPELATRRVVGTDIAHAVPLTLVSGMGHAWLGNVHWLVVLALLIGSQPGIWFGSQLVRKLPDSVIRAALCLCLCTASWKVLAA